MNWTKIFKSAGITTGVCLTITLVVFLVYSLAIRAPQVQVDRPFFGLNPDSVIGAGSGNSGAWDADFSDILNQVTDEELFDDVWERRPNFYTFLLFALDNQFNADAIWVVGFSTETHELHIVDFPRDIRVLTADRTIQRLNAAYPIGYVRAGHDEGVRDFRNEIAWVTGFEVDFYMSVTMQAFARAVDVFGGVTVDIPRRMEYISPEQNLHINLFPGVQRLTGTQAMHFARWRQNTDHTGNIGTEGRLQHIFMLFEALAREARTPATLLRIPDLLATYRSYVRTDLELSNLLYFANEFLRNDVEMHLHRIPVSYITRPRWYDVPYHDETLELINRTINPFTRDIEVIMFVEEIEEEEEQ